MLDHTRQGWIGWRTPLLPAVFAFFLPTASWAQPDLIISNISPGDSQLSRSPLSPLGASLQGLLVVYIVQNQGTATSGSFQVVVHASCRPQPIILGRVSGGLPVFDEGPLPAAAVRTTLTDILLPPGKTCTVRAVADPSNAVKEINEANNELTQILNVPEVKLKNVNVHRNNRLDTYITFDVKNTGPAAFDPTLRVEKLTGVEGGLQGLWSVKSGNIPVGGKSSFTVGTNALPAGHNALRIGAYYGDVFPLDLKLVDYKKDRAGGLPDLKIMDVHRHSNNEPDVYITYKVKNAGTAASPPFTVSYELLGAIAPCGGPTPNPSPGLSRGEVREYTIPTGCLAPGEHRVKIYIDPASEIAEEKILNNWAEQPYKKR